MNRKFKRLTKFLSPSQKREVMRKLIIENQINNEQEKIDLFSKLDKFDNKEIEQAWIRMIDNFGG